MTFCNQPSYKKLFFVFFYFHLLVFRATSILLFQLGQFRFVTHIISCFFFNYIYIILINRHSVCFCNQRPVNLLLHCFPCIFVEMITDDRDCPTHRYALLEYKAVRIYPQCIRYHPQNGIPVLLPASYIPSRRIAFDD